ncbi:hypothetical protein BTVI_26820 [Pitangus sulphuratus]|nr:hypothetical protein BTVI_26820 [Pitangus sulphuratus]
MEAEFLLQRLCWNGCVGRDPRYNCVYTNGRSSAAGIAMLCFLVICIFHVPLLKFKVLDLHFMYLRSEARDPVFVNCLCLHISSSNGCVTLLAWENSCVPVHSSCAAVADLGHPYYLDRVFVIYLDTLRSGREHCDDDDDDNDDELNALTSFGNFAGEHVQNLASKGWG